MSSNNTSDPVDSSAETPTSTPPSTTPPDTTPSSSPPTTPPTSTPTPTTPSSTSTPTPSSSSTPSTSSTPTPTPTPSTTPTPTPSSTPTPTPTTSSTTVVVTSSNTPITSVIIETSTATPTNQDSSSSTSSTSTPTPINPSGSSGSKGLSESGKVAIGVVVPIAAIAFLVLVGLFWWKKRRARRAAEDERRKEVEDYSYNPNADPTIPAVGMGGDAYEMREDGSSGYRGWGSTTLAGSTGRKASTTMSGGQAGAYSDMNSPTRANQSTGSPPMDASSEGEILGAMGPAAANNRGDVHRGPSNASSSYSAAGRSDGSDGAGGQYGNPGGYQDQYGQNPYSDNAYGPPGQPIIRDNPARRNTRIENTSHYPQQSAGISQNF